VAGVSARLAVLSVALLAAGTAAAHELRPGYLVVRELAGGAYEARFRVPTREGRALALRAVLPEACRELGPSAFSATRDARDTRWRFACPDGLTGREIRIDGLEATLTDVLVRIERADGSAQVARLLPRAPSLRVEATPAATDVARTYLALGAEHVLGGADHLLFVLALLLLARGGRRLVTAISAFTLAHSVTLGAAALGFVRVAPQPVEAAIALSVAFLARDLVVGERRTTRLWLVAFAFGLLHGLGFAGALREVGLPPHAIPLALFCFNVGVEMGQLAFAAAVLAPAAALLRRLPARRWREPLLGYAFGALAAGWTIERVAGFWS
jgi:hydrogenase/urease accessory protein HupE